MKIRCPVCNGTKQTFDSKYGWVTCLHCEGTGIVENTFKEQEIKKNIEIGRIHAENSKSNDALPKVSKAESKSNNGCIIGIIVGVLAIILVVLLWDSIWDGIKSVLETILYIISAPGKTRNGFTVHPVLSLHIMGYLMLSLFFQQVWGTGLFAQAAMLRRLHR